LSWEGGVATEDDWLLVRRAWVVEVKERAADVKFLVLFIKKKIQQDAIIYQNFIIPCLYEA
jgi:hypothetical protein